METPPPPAGLLDISVPGSEWTPLSIGQANGRMLAEAIAAQRSLAILLEQNYSIETLSDQVYDMVKAVAPEIQVLMRQEAVLDWMATERGEIPYRVSSQPGGTDATGQPYYLPAEHPLHTDWLSKNQAMKGAEAVLTVGELRSIDDAMLRNLRKGRRGGCEELKADLAGSVNRLNGFFRPFKEAVDQALVDAFARHLEAALPFWQHEIAFQKRRPGTSQPAMRCLHGFAELLARLEPCLETNCAAAPAFHPVGGGIIGMVDEGGFVPDSCPVEGQRDYRAELRDLASRATSEVLTALDGQWTGDLIRADALQRMAAGMEEVCAPRHRRISPQDLQTARSAVAGFLTGLNRAEATGQWALANGQERVLGTGPVAVLARVRTQGSTVAVNARQLVERIRRFDQCDGEGEKVIRAMLIDVGRSEVLFSGLFFKEELVCNGLPPGIP